jgi:hypothetical protein
MVHQVCIGALVGLIFLWLALGHLRAIAITVLVLVVIGKLSG